MATRKKADAPALAAPKDLVKFMEEPMPAPPPETTAVITAETLPVVHRYWGDLKGWVARRKAEFKTKFKDPLNALRNSLLDQEKQYFDPLDAAVSAIGQKIVAYQQELERARQEAERKAKEQQEREAREKRQKEIDALNAAAQAAPPEHRQIIQAQAQAVAAAPIHVVPVKAAVVGPQPAVTAPTQTRYHAEVDDVGALVLQVGATMMRRTLAAIFPQPAWAAEVIEFLKAFGPDADVKYLEPNMTELNALATQCGETLPLRGVRGVGNTTLVNRPAKAAAPAQPAAEPARAVAASRVDDDEAMRF
jgi:hypothetical protein